MPMKKNVIPDAMNLPGTLLSEKSPLRPIATKRIPPSIKVVAIPKTKLVYCSGVISIPRASVRGIR